MKILEIKNLTYSYKDSREKVLAKYLAELGYSLGGYFPAVKGSQ